MSTWPIWIAIVLLLDAGIGLWNANRLASLIAPKRLLWIAALEALIAIGLVAWHFTR